MVTKTTSIELNIIQNFTPSNLNRDDNNYPKMTDFGGVRRARISSQCIKRSIRVSTPFKESIPVDIGFRTRRMLELLTPPLVKAGKSPEDAEKAVKAFTTVYAGLDTDNNGYSSVLVYLSAEDVAAMNQAILTHWDDILGAVVAADGKYPKDTLKKNPALKKSLTEIAKLTAERTSAPDIALYGRMLADNPRFALPAASQIAQAISTHAVETEYDYFVAIDDRQPEEETGAGQINVTGFNSACYYRYASLDWDQLKKNLRKQGLETIDVSLARDTVNAFLRASIEATPTGMKSRFAQNIQPDFALALVRHGGPSWSLANAFDRPIRTGTPNGLIGPSVSALDRYLNNYFRAYGTESIKAVVFFAIDPEIANAAENLLKQYTPAASWLDWRNTILNVLD